MHLFCCKIHSTKHLIRLIFLISFDKKNMNDKCVNNINGRDNYCFS